MLQIWQHICSQTTVLYLPVWREEGDTHTLQRCKQEQTFPPVVTPLRATTQRCVLTERMLHLVCHTDMLTRIWRLRARVYMPQRGTIMR